MKMKSDDKRMMMMMTEKMERERERACRFQHPQKKLAQRLDSLVRVSRRVEREQKKRVHIEDSCTSRERSHS